MVEGLPQIPKTDTWMSKSDRAMTVSYADKDRRRLNEGKHKGLISRWTEETFSSISVEEIK